MDNPYYQKIAVYSCYTFINVMRRSHHGLTHSRANGCQCVTRWAFVRCMADDGLYVNTDARADAFDIVVYSHYKHQCKFDSGSTYMLTVYILKIATEYYIQLAD